MATTRWVRYVVPVMVAVDCEADKITGLVALPEEAREDRDDSGHFCIYDENFVRRHADGGTGVFLDALPSAAASAFSSSTSASMIRPPSPAFRLTFNPC